VTTESPGAASSASDLLDRRRRSGITIPVTSAVGTGPTPVAAFDAALRQAGIADLNLIRLSSVIPTGATVEVCLDEASPLVGTTAEWGDRHYVVYADARATDSGQLAAACVGWVQDPDTGAGLFVEVEGHDEDQVRADVVASLEAMTAARGLDLDPPMLVSRSIRCDTEPVCALVIASFTTEGWE
jgi:arginine decarboxylase